MFDFLFGYHRPGYADSYFGGYDDDYGAQWSNRREKSGAAEKREDMVMQRFNAIKKQVKNTLLEKTMVTIKLGCDPRSQSPLKSLPGILIEDICQFAGLPKATPNPSTAAPSAVAASRSASSHATKKKKGNKADVGENIISIDLKDFNIYIPGEKLVIPLTTPNEHLTGPCWRDFGRAVRRNPRWEVKRVAATPAEKAKYKETRKGKVYFINVIFTVPGKPSAKPTKKTSAKSTGKRVHDNNGEAYRIAVLSGVNSITGEVDGKKLKQAMDAGYSQQTILAKVAELRGDGDQKPSAKKLKQG